MAQHDGNRLFITSIMKQAFTDMLHCPDASTDNYVKYRVGSKAYDSRDAKRFINKDNHQFQYYCCLLGMDYEYAEKKFYDQIRKVTKSPELLKVLKDAL